MKLRRLASNLLLVGFVVFVLDFSIGHALRFFYFEETSGIHYRMKTSIESTTSELLILGSSRANHHYISSILSDTLGITVFNTGIEANGIYYQLAVLKSVLKRYKPKVILIDLAWVREYNDLDNLSSMLPYYRNHKEMRDIIRMKSRLEPVKLVSEIYPFNSQILTILIGTLKSNRTRKPDDNGYVALYNEWNGEPETLDLSNFRADMQKINAFKEMLDLSNESGIRTYVFCSPIYEKFIENYETEIACQICKEKNVLFFDYSSDPRFLNDYSLFNDPGHLNHHGAEIYTKIVASQLKKDLYKVPGLEIYP